MTDFEKIAHVIRFGLPFHKVTQEAIVNWADNKVNEKDSDNIFFDLSTANNSNKIIELLSDKVDWNFKDPEIRQLILSYYKDFLKANPSKWLDIETELVNFFELIEYESSNDKTDDFLYYLGDDLGLRKDGYGGLLAMPDYLTENLSQYRSYNNLKDLLTKSGLVGYKI